MAAHTGIHIDWQAVIALAFVALAAAYLARRWWPGLRGLLGTATPSSSPADDKACGGTHSPASAAPCGSGQGSGCGNCGQHATPAKDHRVHIVRRPTHTEQG